ncbi:CBS domain-containing protein [Natrinema sp. HArc-T2]|uniref:CBS domain-containing protein n=1 Tax=Natrinema sp. HArc-T2 TaxID=3242701 RepID=UPI00359DA8E3
MPEIKTIVREEVVSASPTTALTELAELMDDENVGSIVIVEDGHPRGIVTDRDLALQAVAHGADPTTATAADVMSDDPVTVELDSGILDVIRVMTDSNVRRIPATDEDGQLAGIVTFDDFVVLLSRELKLLGELVEAEVPPYEHT